MSGRVLVAALVLRASITGAVFSDTINPIPQPGGAFMSMLQEFDRDEDSDRFLETACRLASFVHTGCLGATAASLTHTPSACLAYAGGYRVVEVASITYNDNAVCWVIVDDAITGDLVSSVTFTRVTGTHYLVNCTSPTQPTLPTNTAWLMKVTTASGAITQVDDLRASGQCPGTGGGGAGLLHVQDEGTPLPDQDTLNCVGAGITCSDDVGGARTTINVPQQQAYDTVVDEAVTLTQRRIIQFTGDGVSCVDNVGATRTDCTIAGGGGGGGATEKCITVDPVLETMDNYEIWMGPVGGVTLVSAGCQCHGNCTGTRAEFTFQDRSGNAILLTGGGSLTCGTSTAATTFTLFDVTDADRILLAGEGLRINVTTVPTNLGRATLCVRF